MKTSPPSFPSPARSEDVVQPSASERAGSFLEPFDQRRANVLSRGLWLRFDYDSLQTELRSGDDETCVLCGAEVPDGPAFLIYEARSKNVVGYADVPCHDLAYRHGVTRAETRTFSPGTALVPAGAARVIVEMWDASIAKRKAL